MTNENLSSLEYNSMKRNMVDFSVVSIETGEKLQQILKKLNLEFETNFYWVNDYYLGWCFSHIYLITDKEVIPAYSAVDILNIILHKKNKYSNAENLALYIIENVKNKKFIEFLKTSINKYKETRNVVPPN